MTNKEHLRKGVIRELVAGVIDGTEAACKLRLSVRQVKRLKHMYIQHGEDGLIHQARGKQGSRKIDEKIEQQVVAIIRQNYVDFGPVLATEKLRESHEITFDPETIRHMMIRAGIWKAKQRRKTTYRCWRERKESFGELQQFDGSYHNWFEGRNPVLPEVCLLASIDDATGKITHAMFDHNEGVVSVFQFWKTYIQLHGIPLAIYLDKFSTYKINHKSAVDNHDLMTQFGRTAKELDIKLITAHSPQAKGRVERLFGTLQDRLVKELRLNGINTIPEANLFLSDIFIPWFNTRFAVVPSNEVDIHRQLSGHIQKQLPSIFSQQSMRSINHDFTIQFHTLFYQLQEVQPTTVYKTDRVLMEERLDGSIHILYKNHYLTATVLPGKPKRQNRQPTILTTHKLNWTPPADHPWRQFVIS